MLSSRFGAGSGRDQLDLQPNANLYGLETVQDDTLKLWGRQEERDRFPAHPFEGARVGDRYRIIKYLAKGSYCHCFTAVDTLEDQIVCIKTFKPIHFYDKAIQTVARDDNIKGLWACRNQKELQNEQKMQPNRAKRDLWMVAHKHMVNIVDVTGDHEPMSIVLKNGLQGMIHIICEEFCEFGTLGEFVQKRALDPEVPEAVLFFIDQLLIAVHGLHEAGFAHLDIKSDNIMVTRHPDDPDMPCLKLGDFGFVKKLRADANWVRFERPGSKAPWWFHLETREITAEDPHVASHNPVHKSFVPECARGRTAFQYFSHVKKDAYDCGFILACLLGSSPCRSQGHDVLHRLPPSEAGLREKLLWLRACMTITDPRKRLGVAEASEIVRSWKNRYLLEDALGRVFWSLKRLQDARLDQILRKKTALDQAARARRDTLDKSKSGARSPVPTPTTAPAQSARRPQTVVVASIPPPPPSTLCRVVEARLASVPPSPRLDSPGKARVRASYAETIGLRVPVTDVAMVRRWVDCVVEGINKETNKAPRQNSAQYADVDGASLPSMVPAALPRTRGPAALNSTKWGYTAGDGIKFQVEVQSKQRAQSPPLIPPSRQPPSMPQRRSFNCIHISLVQGSELETAQQQLLNFGFQLRRAFGINYHQILKTVAFSLIKYLRMMVLSQWGLQQKEGGLLAVCRAVCEFIVWAFESRRASNTFQSMLVNDHVEQAIQEVLDSFETFVKYMSKSEINTLKLLNATSATPATNVNELEYGKSTQTVTAEGCVLYVSTDSQRAIHELVTSGVGIIKTEKNIAARLDTLMQSNTCPEPIDSLRRRLISDSLGTDTIASGGRNRRAKRKAAGGGRHAATTNIDEVYQQLLFRTMPPRHSRTHMVSLHNKLIDFLELVNCQLGVNDHSSENPFVARIPNDAIAQESRIFANVPTTMVRALLSNAGVNAQQLPTCAWAPDVGNVENVMVADRDPQQFARVTPARKAVQFLRDIIVQSLLPESAPAQQLTCNAGTSRSRTFPVRLDGTPELHRMHARNRLVYIYMQTRKFHMDLRELGSPVSSSRVPPPRGKFSRCAQLLLISTNCAHVVCCSVSTAIEASEISIGNYWPALQRYARSLRRGVCGPSELETERQNALNSIDRMKSHVDLQIKLRYLTAWDEILSDVEFVERNEVTRSKIQSPTRGQRPIEQALTCCELGITLCFRIIYVCKKHGRPHDRQVDPSISEVSSSESRPSVGDTIVVVQKRWWAKVGDEAKILHDSGEGCSVPYKVQPLTGHVGPQWIHSSIVTRKTSAPEPRTQNPKNKYASASDNVVDPAGDLHRIVSEIDELALEAQRLRDQDASSEENTNGVSLQERLEGRLQLLEKLRLHCRGQLTAQKKSVDRKAFAKKVNSLLTALQECERTTAHGVFNNKICALSSKLARLYIEWSLTKQRDAERLRALDQAKKHLYTALEHKLDHLTKNHPSSADTITELAHWYRRSMHETGLDSNCQHALTLFVEALNIYQAASQKDRGISKLKVDAAVEDVKSCLDFQAQHARHLRQASKRTRLDAENAEADEVKNSNSRSGETRP